MENLTEQIVGSTFWVGFANFLNRIGALIFSIILARFFLPENFGLYSLTMSVAAVFMLFADLGLNQTMIRYFSLYKNRKKSAVYFQYILKLKFLTSFVIAFILLILAYPLSFYIFKKPNLFLPLLAASFFVLTSSLVNFLVSLFYAIKKTKYIFAKELIFQSLRLFLTILVFVFIGFAYYVFGIVIAIILTNIFILFLLVRWLLKFVPFVFKKYKEKIEKKKILKFLGYVIIISISSMFFTYIDTIILGLFVSFSYIGYFSIASIIIFGIISLFAYLGLVLLPIFTSLSKKELGNAFNKVLRFLLIFLVPIAFGILALGKYLIKILYGADYLHSTFPLYFLSLLLIVYIPTSLIGTLFLSKGKPKYIVKIILISLFLNIVLSYILISSLLKISELWAIGGAALSSVISRYFLFFYFVKLTKRKLKLKIESSIFIKPIIASLIMFLFLYSLNSFVIKELTLYLGILEVIVGIIFYLFIMVVIKGITKDDIILIKKLIKKFLFRDFYKPLQHSSLKKEQ